MPGVCGVLTSSSAERTTRTPWCFHFDCMPASGTVRVSLYNSGMPFATINGIRVHYAVQGSGPHLLMFAPGGWRSVMSRWTAAGGKEAFGEMDGLATLSRYFTTIA